jgi:hypothetical protein
MTSLLNLSVDIEDQYQTIEEIEDDLDFSFSDDYKIKNEKVIIDIFNGKYDHNSLDYTPEVLNTIGLYHMYKTKDLKVISKYFIEAFQKGYIPAIYNLGKCYEEYGNDEDEISQEIMRRCYTCYKIAAKNGNIVAMIRLGELYYQDESYENMKTYYLMAIEKGDSNAMLKLADYYSDEGMNNDEAKKYYLMAVEKGNTNGMLSLANYYTNIEKNVNEMKKYAFMAIRNNNGNAASFLGDYYLNSEDEKNTQLAKKFYLYGVKLNNTFSMFALGNYYRDIEHNYVLMHYYYSNAHKKCIESGTKEDIEMAGDIYFNVGYYYYQIMNNYPAAVRCYLNASSYEINAEAFCELGHYHQHITHNYEQMIKYYTIAIENDDSDAMYYMSKYYAEIENNTEKMMEYYIMAQEHNNELVNEDSDFIRIHIVSKLTSSETTDECIVCYENSQMYYTSCGRHTICLECSIKVFGQPCPYCRKRIQTV